MGKVKIIYFLKTIPAVGFQISKLKLVFLKNSWAIGTKIHMKA